MGVIASKGGLELDLLSGIDTLPLLSPTSTGSCRTMTRSDGAAFPSLPVELWAYILDLSSYPECLSLSSVSRLHRALAFPVIFESLNLTVPEVTTELREPDSTIQAERLQGYLRLDYFLTNIVEGRTPIPYSMKRLSVRPLIKDHAWVPEEGKQIAKLRRYWR